MSVRALTVAIAGHPNSGKTSLFNAITALRQHTGNYPGVTVEKKEGTCRYKGIALRVVDLPGTYSLTAYSTEELLARDYILQHRPDVVVVTVDCSNLERNLYLATQLLELGVPVVVAFNMFDRAEAAGLKIDCPRLAALLGAPIVPTVASRGKGVEQLLAAVVQVAHTGQAALDAQRQVDYGKDIEPAITTLSEMLKRTRSGDGPPRPRWLAVKLLENDEVLVDRIRHDSGGDAQAALEEALRARQHIEAVWEDPLEIVLAGRRYGFIAGACAEAITAVAAARQATSDHIDGIVINRYLGLPIFAVAMFAAFQVTFWLGNPVVGWLESGKDGLAAAIHRLGDSGLLISLLADGVVEGVGAVVQFVPLIAMVFLAIAVMEDSGYMARAAFVLDRLMHHMGLHGKSFIPMVIGFGCTVPAVLATRVLEDRRDRLTTMMVLPLMSCGARLPVYLLILGGFFPQRVIFRVLGLIDITNQALLLLLVYAIGVVMAIVLARLLRGTILRGEGGSFVMELPAYRMPTLRGLALHTWQRTWVYLRKAGTVILAMSIILWAMKTWPRLGEGRREAFQAQRQAASKAAAGGHRHAADLTRQIDLAEHQAELEHSAVGRIGRALEPVLRPCGFDWRISSALVGSLAAKEVFVSQMGVIHAVGAHGQEQSLRSRLSAEYTGLQGFCIMLFVLISAPCVGTVAVTLRESGSWRWAALQWGGLTALAWAVTGVVYQVGRALSPLLSG